MRKKKRSQEIINLQLEVHQCSQKKKLGHFIKILRILLLLEHYEVNHYGRKWNGKDILSATDNLSKFYNWTKEIWTKRRKNGVDESVVIELIGKTKESLQNWDKFVYY